MLTTRRWKRHIVIWLGCVVALSLLGSLLLYLVGQAPAFYGKIEQLTLEDRQAASRQFVRQSTAIWNQIANESAWSGMFRETQVNAWLAGDFSRKHSDVLPGGVSEPRVCFEGGRISLAFRMQRGPVTALISATGRVWLPESNLVAIELERVQAGIIRMPASVVIQTVSAAAKSGGLEVEWRQHAGKPVALVRFAQSESPAGASVERLELRDGLLQLAGRSRGQPRVVGTSRTQHPAVGRADPSADSGSSEVSLNVQSSEAPLNR